MIAFNETIGAANHEQLARRHVAETVALLDGPSWTRRPTRCGVEAFASTIDTRDMARGGATAHADIIKASIEVATNRAELFSLISEPKRAPEWDKTDRGFEWVEVFDDDDTVFHNFNKPLLRKIDSVLYRVVRPDHDPGRSLYCARSVISPKAPLGPYRRLYQQIFAWAVRELGPDSCELTVMASAPVGFLPAFIQRLVFLPGWRSDLGGIRKRYR